MRGGWANAAALLAVLLAPGPRPAQARPAAEEPVYGGCLFAGRPVPSIASRRLDDIAAAAMDPARGPVIFYNPGILYDWPPPVQTFFYWHECAHHALGHTVAPSYPLAREQAADCWAIREVFQRGLFGQKELAQLQRAMAVASRADWTHLPGPVRALNLETCLKRGV